MSGSAAEQTAQKPRYAAMKNSNRINPVNKPPILVVFFMLLRNTDQPLQNLVRNVKAPRQAKSRLVGPFWTGELIALLLGHNRALVLGDHSTWETIHVNIGVPKYHPFRASDASSSTINIADGSTRAGVEKNRPGTKSGDRRKLADRYLLTACLVHLE